MKKLFLAVALVMSLAGQSYAQWDLTAGDGIDLNTSGSMVIIDAEEADTTNKGVASFNSTHFSTSSGAVSLQTEFLQDTGGAMVTGNTETGITVTYQDADGTTDFVTDVTASSTNTFTNKTIDGDDNTVQDLPYSAIKSTSRTGSDVKVVTGTAGSTDECAKWNVDGDLVSAGAACGSGSGDADGLGTAADLTDLTADANPTSDDLIYVVNDPSGTPAQRKVTLDDAIVGYANSLVADPDNCDAGSYPTGVDAEGHAQGCTIEHDAVSLVGFTYLDLDNQMLTAGTINLTEHTEGPYVASATTDGFLVLTGTEGGSLGMRTDCGANNIPKWDGNSWECAADADSGAGTGAPTNTSTTYVTLSTSSTLLGERTLAPATGATNDGITATDGGAGSTFTLAIDLKTVGENAVGTTASVSGMEFESEELTLLQGCADGEVLKWREATDDWGCDADLDSGGSISGTDTHCMYFDGANNPGGEAGCTYNDGTDSMTLVGNLTVAAEAYDATGWNADNTVPTKNDVRDKIEALSLGAGAFTDGGSIIYPNDDIASLAVDGTTSAASFYYNASTNVLKTDGGYVTGNNTATTGLVTVHTVDVSGISDATQIFDRTNQKWVFNYPVEFGGTGNSLTFGNGESIDNLTDGVVNVTGSFQVTGGLADSGGACDEGETLVMVAGEAACGSAGGGGSGSGAVTLQVGDTTTHAGTLSVIDLSGAQFQKDSENPSEEVNISIKDIYVSNTGDTLTGTLLVDGGLKVDGLLADADGNCAEGEGLIIAGGVATCDSAGGGVGDVTAGANMTDNSIVRGDGGVKGVQDTAIIIDDSDNVTGINNLQVNGTVSATGGTVSVDGTLQITNTGAESQIIFTDSAADCWKLTMTTAGTLAVASVPCP